MTYLVKLTPLEPYFFGTEKTFSFQGVKKTVRDSYYIRSKDVPEQTTLLGMLRFVVLAGEKGLLKSDFNYSEEETEKMKELIGERSFDYSAEEVQDFGSIKKLSPVFLINEQGEYLVKNPFHNKAANGYQPMEMEVQTLATSHGSITLPKVGEYDAKNGYGRGYFNVASGKVEDGLFRAVNATGSRKNGREDRENSFFKKEMKLLKKGYSFALFVDADKLPEETVCYMGQKRSAFRMTAVEAENNLEDKVKAAFAGSKEPWQYALSDIVLEKVPVYSEFAIVEKKQVRNLKTVYSGKRIRQNESQLNLIESGSVFYKSCPVGLENENCKNIGYNHIIDLGGN